MSSEFPSDDPMAQRLSDPKGIHKEAWQRTLTEMNEIAEAREEDGWEATTIMVARTNTTSKQTADAGNWGLVHIVPNNFAERFEAVWDSGGFSEYLVYGRLIDGYMYFVTEFIDPDNERSILIASRYDLAWAQGMIENAREEDVLYTHLKTIDGTIIGSFKHEKWEPFIPDPA